MTILCVRYSVAPLSPSLPPIPANSVAFKVLIVTQDVLRTDALALTA